MICRCCNNEFDEMMFDICPFCLTPAIMVNAKNAEETTLTDLDTFATNDTDQDYLNCQNEKTEIVEDYISTQMDMGEAIEPPAELIRTKSEKIVVPDVDLMNIYGLSIRAKNILKRNNITDFVSLLCFLKEHRISELCQKGEGIVEDMAYLISYLLCGDFQDEPLDDKKPEDDSLEQKVIYNIVNNITPNISLEDLLGNIPIRVFNTLKRNKAEDILGIAKLMVNVPLKDIKGGGILFRDEVLKILGDYLEGSYTNEKRDKNNVTMLEERLIESIGSREYNVFLRRAKGETLQDIADTIDNSNGETLTRERVRQIESNFGRKYRNNVRLVANERISTKGYITEKELVDLYNDEELGIIMSYVLKWDMDYEYLDFANCFVKKVSGINEEKRILNLIEDVIGDGFNLYNNIEMLEDIFISNNIPYMGLGELINLLEKTGYRIYGEYVTKGRVSYAYLCKMLISEYYPNGIKLNQDDNSVCEDLVRLRKLAYARFGDIGLPESDRALSARLGSLMVSCGRGRVITEDRIDIDLDVLYQIKRYIDNLEVEKIYYSEVFANFEGILKMTSNVDNYYFLHGVLFLYFPDDYMFSRDFLIRKDYEGRSANNADRVRAFISEQGRTVSKNEIKTQFPGFSAIMIDLMFDTDPFLLRWDYNTFSCIDLISINSREKDDFRGLLISLLHRNGGFVSEIGLYDEMYAFAEDFLNKNNISKPINLFYLFSKLYTDIADFRHPNIGEKNKLRNLTTKDIALYLLGSPQILNYDDFSNVADKMKWPLVSVSSIFSKIEQSYYRVSDNKYIINESFSIPEETVNLVKDFIESLLDEGYLPLSQISNFDELPDCEYEWNSFLLESVIKKYLSEYKFVSPDYRDRRYQRSIIVRKEERSASYAELVAKVFKEAGYSEMNESQFSSFLIVRGLAKQVVPQEIKSSGWFVYEKEKYILAEERKVE
ncbi:MAG: hypothetical protein K6E47_17210 [Lachnospiraceae bacterium]|nr:hypothetical protein [Lachnospiraceae bacterium]